MTPKQIIQFQQAVLNWYDQFGRKDLPWQHEITPYRVWLSEIMLQQTQVTTVIPYFHKFIEHFPTIDDLANANIDIVLSLWAGLGYYARARNLYKTARIISHQMQGVFPQTVDELAQLPGIGRSTAGAIIATAFQQKASILDGNVKRVLTRYFAIAGWPGEKQIHDDLWHMAESLTPNERVRDYTQAMMDLGATICTRSNPKCDECPLQAQCQGLKTGNPTQFPGKKPKKKLPVKSTIMLVLANETGAILLKKRPPTGIWGGLWSLPEFETMDSLENWLMQMNQSQHQPTYLTAFRHTFTHYHLDIEAYHLDIEAYQLDNVVFNMIADDDIVWVNPQQLDSYGKSAAVDKILKNILDI